MVNDVLASFASPVCIFIEALLKSRRTRANEISADGFLNLILTLKIHLSQTPCTCAEMKEVVLVENVKTLGAVSTIP